MMEKVIMVDIQIILDLQKQVGILIGQNSEIIKTNSRIEDTLINLNERIVNLESKEYKDEGAKQVKTKSADRQWEITRHGITALISAGVTWICSKVFP